VLEPEFNNITDMYSFTNYFNNTLANYLFLDKSIPTNMSMINESEPFKFPEDSILKTSFIVGAMLT
jgi:hypothetical protein